MPSDLEEDAPYPDHVMGWYIGYEDDTLMAHGYAYAEVLEQGGTPTSLNWVNDEDYILWPAYVWEI